jgi:hypothetical protein
LRVWFQQEVGRRFPTNVNSLGLSLKGSGAEMYVQTGHSIRRMAAITEEMCGFNVTAT